MARQQFSISGSSRSRSNTSRQTFPRVIGSLFFGIFFLVGSILFVTLFVWPLAEYFAAKSWVETPCTILSSEVVADRSSDSTTYRAEVTFRYQFADQEHESNRCQLLTVSTSSRSRAERIAEMYQVGQLTSCFVNPQQPQTAVLQRDLSWDFLFCLFPLLFLLIGLGGLVFVWRSSPQRKRDSRAGKAARAELTRGWNTSSAAGTSSHLSDWPHVGLEEREEDDDRDPSLPPRQPEGPRVLTPASTPIAAFVGMLCIALFWNGIVSVFVAVAISA
jgi:hypothetical protein